MKVCISPLNFQAIQWPSGGNQRRGTSPCKWPRLGREPEKTAVVQISRLGLSNLKIWPVKKEQKEKKWVTESETAEEGRNEHGLWGHCQCYFYSLHYLQGDASVLVWNLKIIYLGLFFVSDCVCRKTFTGILQVLRGNTCHLYHRIRSVEAYIWSV